MVAFITSICHSVEKLCKIPLIAFFINFIVSSLSAYFSITVLTYSMKEYLTFIQKLKKDQLVKIYRQYIIKYVLTTGFFSAVILHKQLKSVDIIYATLCGIIGPHILKDVLIGGAISTFKRYAKKVEKEPKKLYDDYLKKKVEERLEE